MKTLIFLASFILLATSSPVFNDYDLNETNLTYFWIEEAPGVYRKENLTGVPELTASDKHVKIYFYNRDTASRGILLDITDASAVAAAGFSNSKQTIFIIHGWLNGHKTSINRVIRKAYLSTYDVNVFIVDWSRIALRNYITAQGNVRSVGTLVAGRIGALVANSGLNLDNTVIVGHSLGAHIAGVLGKELQGKADHIVGLDPAGPLFSMMITNNRIEPSSGQFVQIIHTNAGMLGMNKELGHADYWPNGGKTQAGCIADVTGICSHNLVFDFYAESVKTGNFIARTCKDWRTYRNGGCANEQSSWMGQAQVDKTAQGNYYLATNRSPPYAQGE